MEKRSVLEYLVGINHLTHLWGELFGVFGGGFHLLSGPPWLLFHHPWGTTSKHRSSAHKDSEEKPGDILSAFYSTEITSSSSGAVLAVLQHTPWVSIPHTHPSLLKNPPALRSINVLNLIISFSHFVIWYELRSVSAWFQPLESGVDNYFTHPLL